AISKTSKFPTITQNLIAYSDFLYLKEYAGIERALGTELISSKVINQKKINNFNAIIVKQKIFKELFFKYSTDSLKVKQKKFLELEKMRKIILSAKKEKIDLLNVNDWFGNSTLKIEELKNIDNKLTSKILIMLKNKLAESQKKLFIILIFNLFFIILFIFMLFRLLTLLKSEQRLRALIDTHVIISETNLKGIITDTSQAFCHISGYKKEELIGKPHNIIRHPDMPKEAFKDMWKTIQDNKVWTGSVKNIRNDGSYYWVEAIISPKYENGIKVGYTALRQDITDKIKVDELNQTLEKKIAFEVDKHRQKDQQLFQQSRLAQMGEMISMIAHQWRQPLSAISSTSGAINLKARLGKLDNQTARTLSEDISQYTKHLSTTIDDFREFFKSNKDLKQTTYTELINGVLKIIESSIKTQHIELILELDNNDSFYTYPNEIRQVILNLIKNAEDVLLEKEIKSPYIKIRTYKEDTKLILEVVDNGGGVPDEIKENIFDPYFSTKTKKDGTGLGLYMSKTIIEEHCHGKLSLSNSDDGAIFKIILESEHE
ncbi:MAG: PAS domain S-box protein, partial [Epsilonproteobacteria bacterium]|nr:PAS domain S-box protein [Campylobacterota bacterium]